jgi:predicted permease
MRWARLRSFVRHRIRSRRAGRAIDRELEAYLQIDIDDRIRSGLSPEEARRRALAELGGAAHVREAVLDARAGAWMDAWRHDLRAAFRAVLRAPAFSFAIVASLALGLGAMLAATSLVNTMLFARPSGVGAPDELTRFSVGFACGPYSCGGLTDTEAIALTARDTGTARIAAEASADVAVSLDTAASIRAGLVSDNFFDVLGVRPALGRPFASTDAPEVAVLSHRLWTRMFAADPAIVGRAIHVADVIVQVVGVAPEAFQGLGTTTARPGQTDAEIWLPLRLAARVANAGHTDPTYVARLAHGASADTVRAHLTMVAAQLADARPPRRESLRPDVRPLAPSRLRTASIVFVVLSIPLAVLAIASINAASLLLARASLRSHENAVRLALGAARARLIRQGLLESLALSFTATALALPLAKAVLGPLSGVIGQPFVLDLRLVGAALLLAVATAAAFGLMPVLTTSAERPARAFAGPSRDIVPRQLRLRAALVVVQVAVSIGLLAVSLQVSSSFAAANATSAVDARHVLMASIDLRQVNMPEDEGRRFYQQVVDRVSALGDVKAAGAGTLTAFWRFNGNDDGSSMVWTLDEAPDKGRWSRSSVAMGDLFQVAGARMSQGRLFTRDEQTAARPRVAIVNRAFADQRLGGVAIGRRVRVGVSKDYAAAIEVTIVGVIDPTWTDENGATPTRGAIYFPAALASEPRLVIYALTSNPAVVVTQLRDALRRVDGRVPLRDAATLVERTARAYPEGTLADATRALSIVAFALAGFGLAALVSYLVTIRSHEMAVRLALGARPAGLVHMVVRQALRLAMIGGRIGLPLAFIAGQVVRLEFHQAPGIDVPSTVTSLGLLVAVALAASALPAIRASRTSPLALLKEQ